MNKLTFILIIGLLSSSCDKITLVQKLFKPKTKIEYSREYYPSRKIMRVTEVVDGKRQGTEKIYYETGEIKSMLQYTNNLLDGECVNYYPNGTRKSVAIYSKNVKNGTVVNYYPTGKVYSELPYLNGDMHGEVKKHYKTGKLMSSQVFRLGLPTTQLKEFDQAGKPDNDRAKLIVTEVDEIVMYNKFTLKVNFDKKNKKDVFYLGRLDEEGGIPKTANQIDTYNGVGEITYSLPPGSIRIEPVYIIGITKSHYGNKQVVEKRYNLSVKN